MKDVKRDKLCFVLLCLLLLCSVDSLTWTGQPANPTEAVEGKNVVLTWNYSLTADEQTNSQTFFIVKWSKFNLSSLVFDTIASKTFVGVFDPPSINYQEPLSPHIVVNRNHKTDTVSLHINELRRDDEGQYKIEYIKDIAGTLLADLVMNLTVLVPPEVDYLTSDWDECENTTLILTCNATGKPIPNITWRREGSDGTVIEKLPAVNGVYVLNNTNRNSSGQYRCTASSRVGIANKTVNVTVRYAPSIDQIVNSSNTVNEGGFFSMTCNASGYPSPTNYMYTWINKDGERRNGSVLSFVNISRAEAGQYRCEVENRCGMDGRNASVNVHYPPNITSISLNQTVVDEGDVVLLNCTADGNPEPNITWTRLAGNGADVRVGPAETYLNIAGKWDEGPYRCIADNGIGNEDFSDVLNITVESYRPINTVFSTNLTNNTVSLNENFTLICKADANPAATFRLYREQEILQEHSNGTYLTFVSTRTKQVPHTCIPFNDFGDGHSKTINVTVYYNPATVHLVTNTTENENCCDFLVISFTCKASEANPPVKNYQLLKNHEIVDTSSKGTWIKTISSKGNHIYSCKALHRLGNVASADVTVTFNVPVQIFVHVQSGSETLLEGGNVSLYCNASGYPEPTVTWTKLNADDLIVSSQLLNFSIISKEATGEYICNANNTCGKKQSAVRTIDVQYKPENVHLNTSSHKICAGKMVILTCSAGDSNPAVENLTLYKNGLRVANVTRANVGVFNQVLYTQGQHIYSCVASNAIGNASSSNAIVEVEVPVQISVHVQSGSETLLEGGNVSLHCSASGYAEATVTWTKLSADDFVVSSQWLNFTIISKEATGEYICCANNTCGKNRSSVRTIDVQYKPENVHLNTSSHKICAGKMVILTCSAGDSNPAVENFTLYKNGLRVANVTRANVGVFNQVLDTQGQHIYSCVASNAIGIASSNNTIVKVEVPASVTMENRTIVVREGDNVTLHCMSSGFPQPNVSWVNNSNYIMEAGSILNLTNIRRHNREYNCSASNACGNDSRQVYIDVQYAAEATGKGGNYSVLEGFKVLFSCPVDGNPEPNITWYKDNEVIEPEIPNAKQLEAGETGCYTCSAVNGLGPPVTITHCLIVDAAEATGKGRNRSVLEGFKVLFPCPVEENPKPNITWYKDNEVIEPEIPNAKQLEAGETGCYTCSAVNGLGPPVTITHCLIVVPEDAGHPIDAELTVMVAFVSQYSDLTNQVSKQLVDSFVLEMDKVYQNDGNYIMTKVTGLRSGSVIVSFTLYFKNSVTPNEGLKELQAAISNGTLGTYPVGNLTLIPSGVSTFASTTPRTAEPPDRPTWIIIVPVAAGVVLLALVVAFVTWWVHKKRKCLKDIKIHNSECEESLHGDSPNAKVNRAYAESGPPSASGTQQSQDLGAIPTYAVVDKSKKKKKKEEKPPIYASVDKSKKRKKKTDDKNLYDNVEEPKKERKPGEVLYAELGDFQNPAMPEVSTSPATLPPLKRPPSYEQTQYADITAFLKGDATLPQKEGNEGSEMQEQGANQSQHDVDNKETPIQEDSPCSRVNGAYAKSGPPSANSTDVSSAAQKQPAQEAGAIPTYAVVDKSKKKKKEPEEMPLVNTDKGKSKKKKKKTDDKNLYDSVEEPKKEKKPGEIFYADLGEFQKQEMPKVATSPPTLPPLKTAPSYEKTDYAEITQFLRKEATLPKVATSPPTLPPIKRSPSYEKTGYAEKEATLPPEKTSNSEMKPQAANQTHDEVENKETAL
ncbi:hemicentin-2-like [Montipora foliosa]|uniref:hemicentin-2-like n=1 Tax=Montipora foliosa TaxID=591990 RepID=UPI0035F17E63